MNSEYKYAIAVSLYNKFDELAILCDIVKKNFKEKIGIFVCSNDNNAQEEIKKRCIPIDGFVQGEDILLDNSQSAEERRLALVLRSTDTVKKSCTLAMNNSNYVTHVHCDAWPMNESELLKLFSFVEDDGFSIAIRGLGWSFTASDRPLGGIDDHFFAFDSAKIKQNNIFEFNTIDMMPHKLTIHGILGAQIVSKLGMSKAIYYDRFENHEVWPGTTKRMPFYPVKPSLYDIQRGFLHVHREAFPMDLGAKLQTYYLEKNNLIKGEHIKKHCALYSSNQVIEELETLLSSLEFKAKLRGIDYKLYGQDISLLNNKISKVSLVTAIKLHSYKSLKTIVNFLLSKKRLSLVKDHNQWPLTIEEIYKKLGVKLRN